MVVYNISDELLCHKNHRKVTKYIQKKLPLLIYIIIIKLTESSALVQTTQRLQSRHCHRRVLIFSTSFSEYFKHDGWPNKIHKKIEIQVHWNVPNTAVSTFGTTDHILWITICIFLFITQAKATNTNRFNSFLNK